jgi:hypothetical protein
MFVGGIDHVDAFGENALWPNVEGCVGVVDGGGVVEGVWLADERILRDWCVWG